MSESYPIRLGTQKERRKLRLGPDTVAAAFPHEVVLFKYYAEGPYGIKSITGSQSEEEDIQNILEHEQLHQTAVNVLTPEDIEAIHSELRKAPKWIPKPSAIEVASALDVPAIKVISHSKAVPEGLDKLAEYYELKRGEVMPAYMRAREILV